MKLVDAFLVTTAVSYVAAAVLPVRPEKKMPVKTQKIGYILAGSLLALLALRENPMLSSVLGVAYGALAVASFTGLQDWGSTNQNLLMTLWDLAVSAACFTKAGGL